MADWLLSLDGLMMIYATGVAIALVAASFGNAKEE